MACLLADNFESSLGGSTAPILAFLGIREGAQRGGLTSLCAVEKCFVFDRETCFTLGASQTVVLSVVMIKVPPLYFRSVIQDMITEIVLRVLWRLIPPA